MGHILVGVLRLKHLGIKLVLNRLSLRISPFAHQLCTTAVVSSVHTSRRLLQFKSDYVLEHSKKTYIHSFFISYSSLSLLTHNEKAHPGPDLHSSVHLRCLCFPVSWSFWLTVASASFLKVYKFKSHCKSDFHGDVKYQPNPFKLDQSS